MSYEQRDNSGSLFKNERKDKDSHPDYTGNGMIDGKEYWFSAWIKTGKNGSKFMSLAFKPKDFAQREQKPDPISSGRVTAAGGGRPPKTYDDMGGDDIPF